MSAASGISLADALDLFLLDCQSRRLTASTITFYRLKVGSFIRWLTDNDVTDLQSIKSHTIKRYIVHLQGKELTDNSQNDYARAVKTFLGYCVRDELLEKSPFTNVQMPKIADSLPIILTDEEIQTALQKVKEHRNRLIIRFILDSGVRASELLALDVGDIDLETVKRYLILRKRPKDKEPLITSSKQDTRLSLVGLMHVFRKMQKQTGIEHLTAHTLRRTMATKSLENGMDAYILARLLGHTDMQMMRRYAAMNRETIQAASAKYSVVDNLD